MDGEHIGTNRRQGPKTACLLRRTEDRAKAVSFETPNTVFTNLDCGSVGHIMSLRTFLFSPSVVYLIRPQCSAEYSTVPYRTGTAECLVR